MREKEKERDGVVREREMGWTVGRDGEVRERKRKLLIIHLSWWGSWSYN